MGAKTSAGGLEHVEAEKECWYGRLSRSELEFFEVVENRKGIRDGFPGARFGGKEILPPLLCIGEEVFQRQGLNGIWIRGWSEYLVHRIPERVE